MRACATASTELPRGVSTISPFFDAWIDRECRHWDKRAYLAMIVTIHLVGVLDRSSVTDRTIPVRGIPFSDNVTLSPRYWAKRKRRASFRSVVSIVCKVRLYHPVGRSGPTSWCDSFSNSSTFVVFSAIILRSTLSVRSLVTCRARLRQVRPCFEIIPARETTFAKMNRNN
jgi:hypothetical protein